jgi:serine/threonine protein kinase
MEFAAGGSLHDHLRARAGAPPPEPAAWRLFLQMLLGLRELHAANVLHRDVKSPNVLLDAEGNAKLGDLGVARVGDGTGRGRTARRGGAGRGGAGAVRVFGPVSRRDP